MNDKGTIVQQLEDELDHLKSQLRKIREAGEVFVAMADLIESVPHAELLGRVYSYHPWSEEVWFALGISSVRSERPFVDTKIEGAHFRRLAQALKEIEDE